MKSEWPAANDLTQIQGSELCLQITIRMYIIKCIWVVTSV